MVKEEEGEREGELSAEEGGRRGKGVGGDGTPNSPTEVTPKLGKGAQDTWRLSWPYGGRLDKTGVTPRRVKRRDWRQTRMAGVYTDQRLNLSKLGKACGRKPRFQTGPGKSGRPGL